jgi:hypothetical protein
MIKDFKLKTLICFNSLITKHWTPYTKHFISSPIPLLNWAIWWHWKCYLKGYKCSWSSRTTGTMYEDSTSFDFVSVHSLTYLRIKLLRIIWRMDGNCWSNTRNVWQTYGIKVRNILKTIRNIINNFIQYILGIKLSNPLNSTNLYLTPPHFNLGVFQKFWNRHWSTYKFIAIYGSILWLILNSYGEPQISVFFLLWWASLIGPSQKINNLALDSQSSPLGLFYRLQEENLWHRIWDKVRSNWEHIGNSLRIWWEHVENNKNPTTHPPPRPHKKSIGPPGCMLPHLIGCKELYCISVFLVTFWPTLMEGTWTKGAY